MTTAADDTRASSARRRTTAVTRRDVVVAALRLVDREGLDELSMRRLAAELDIETMSLYKRVAGKDDLLAGIANLIWEEVADAAPPVDDWGEWLRSYGEAIRGALREHPNAVSLLVQIEVWPPKLLEVCGTQVRRSWPEWPPSAEVVSALGTVTAFALGTAVSERSFAVDDTTDPAAGERQRLRRVARALPPDASDEVVDTAMAMCGCDIADMFAKGLDVIVRGAEPSAK